MNDDYYWKLTVSGKKRNPYWQNQPRVSAGSPRGGQWTSTGGIGSLVSAARQDEAARKRRSSYKAPRTPEFGTTYYAEKYAEGASGVGDVGYTQQLEWAMEEGDDLYDKKLVHANADYAAFMSRDDANTANRVLAELIEATDGNPIGNIIADDWWSTHAATEGNGTITISKYMRGTPYTSAAVSARQGGLSRKDHSMVYFDDVTDAAIRHEFGHIFHTRNDSLFNQGVMEAEAGRSWKEAFAITARAKDTWAECVAENFTLYSMGYIDDMHPSFLKRLRETTNYGW